VLQPRWSHGQVEARLANIPPFLVGMEACVGAIDECALEHVAALGGLADTLRLEGHELAQEIPEAGLHPCHGRREARQAAVPPVLTL
jgi:hypothetical protein